MGATSEAGIAHSIRPARYHDKCVHFYAMTWFSAPPLANPLGSRHSAVKAPLLPFGREGKEGEVSSMQSQQPLGGL